MRQWIIGQILIGILALLAAPAQAAQPKVTPEPTPTRERPAQDAAAQWLTLLDAGQYGESWDAAAALFKQSLTRAQWIDNLTKSRPPLGKLESRKLRVAQYMTDMPGAPTGEYVVIEYDATFAGGSVLIERVTPMKDPDGSWRVAGYFVLPGK